MANIADCPGFETFGADVKSGREALGISRRILAEKVGISPRYLANIELVNEIPSIPVVLQLIKICRLPAERYFNPSLIREDSELRQRIAHKLQLCPERYLPVIEGAIDGALKIKESTDETEGVWKHPLFSFFQGGSAAFFFLKNPGFCGQIKVFSVLYLWGKKRRASTASEYPLAIFGFREPSP